MQRLRLLARRRAASDVKLLTSSRWYSLASTAPAAIGSVSVVMKPLARSSTGFAVVINKFAGSSPCQQAASIGMTRRRRSVMALCSSAYGSARLAIRSTSSTNLAVSAELAAMAASCTSEAGKYSQMQENPRRTGMGRSVSPDDDGNATDTDVDGTLTEGARP